jgi:hypothetical protein
MSSMPAVYLGGEARLGGRMTEIYRSLSQYFQANTGYQFKLNHDLFLPYLFDPLLAIIHSFLKYFSAHLCPQ